MSDKKNNNDDKKKKTGKTSSLKKWATGGLIAAFLVGAGAYEVSMNPDSFASGVITSGIEIVLGGDEVLGGAEDPAAIGGNAGDEKVIKDTKAAPSP